MENDTREDLIINVRPESPAPDSSPSIPTIFRPEADEAYLDSQLSDATYHF